MSFKSSDLMIDVLRSGELDAQPGLVLCGQATATGLDEDEDEEEDDLECGQATAGGNEPTSAARTRMDLALLRRQLGEALAARSSR
jgi:hypothetical protein